MLKARARFFEQSIYMQIVEIAVLSPCCSKVMGDRGLIE